MISISNPLLLLVVAEGVLAIVVLSTSVGAPSRRNNYCTLMELFSGMLQFISTHIAPNLDPTAGSTFETDVLKMRLVS